MRIARHSSRWLSTIILSIFWGAGILASEKLPLHDNDVVVFMGGTNMLRMQQAGFLETTLTQHFANNKGIRFRDLSWEADTVFRQGTVIERWRPDGFGNRTEQLKRLETTVVVLQFGQLESMRGLQELDSFVTAYGQLLDEIADQARLIAIISPTPFQRTDNPLLPDLTKHNTNLSLYVQAIQKLAQDRELPFVDLFSVAPARLTANGMHVLPHYQDDIAKEIARQLGIQGRTGRSYERLRSAVLEKHRLWYDYWRPANWKLLFGDDSQRQFTRGDEKSLPFRQEWSTLLALIEKAETRIDKVGRGEDDPGLLRPAPETLHGDPAADIQEELKSFTVPEGFKVNLFASEKEGLTSPLNIRWDPSGRMYVTVTTTYPHVIPGDLPNDKIILLEDRNDDGVADRSRVFADRLNIPTGIEWGSGGVYVGQNTELLFLKDEDNDGQADSRQILLSGFGNGDSHQTINSFIWSPDGELFFGQGDGCESRVETPWGASSLYQAGFYRLRPRRLQLDPLLDDFMGPGNPWGVAFDAWGQIFSVDGAGGVTFLSPGQIPTTHRRKIGRIGDPGGYCGIGYLDGRHLPQSMQGHFAIGDFKANRVKRFSLSDEGAGFRLHWESPLVQSSHRNFRPVDVKVGPDGAVYVVDWYNPIACHQDDAYRHPQRDKAHGRIWRISTDAPSTRPRDFSSASIREVLDGLQAKEHWTRYQAKRELTRRNDVDIPTAIDAWIRTLDTSDATHEHTLVEALGACATLEIVHRGLLIRLLQAADPRARAFATRLIGRWHDRLENPLDLLEARVVDTHPRVRMEAAMACAAIPEARSLVTLAKLVDQPLDGPLDYAFKQAAHHLKPHWQPAFQAGQLSLESPRQVAVVLNEVGQRELLEPLRRLIQQQKLAGDAKRNALESIVASGDTADLQQFGLLPTVYEAGGIYDDLMHAAVLKRIANVSAQQTLRPTDELKEQLANLLATQSNAVMASVFRLAGIWKMTELNDAVVRTATDPKAPDSVRIAALTAYANLKPPGAATVLTQAATTEGRLEVQLAAVESLTAVDLSAAADVAGILLRSEQITREQVSQILLGFLGRDGGAEQLAASLSKLELTDETARQILGGLFATGQTDVRLLEKLNQSLGAAVHPPAYSEHYLHEVVRKARGGNAENGAILFRSLSCTSCHRTGGKGGTVGPDLSAVGTTLSPERIVEELLWPNRQVKEGFAVLQVVTTDGRIHQGYQRRTKESEMTGDVLLEDLATHKRTRIAKAEVEETRVVGSAMPAGVTSVLSDDQLADLVRYLTSLGEVEPRTASQQQR